jgi:tetratricopeptide (TPR) repeat protein
MKNRRTALKIPPQQASDELAGEAVAPRTAALLLTAALLFPATLALAAQAPAAGTGAHVATAAAPLRAKKSPQAKSKAEFDAYQSAVAEAEPARLEAAAIGFAQRFPASELRPFLFQRAMGLYQQRNNSAKALEMARSVLKFDPANPVALLGAAQLLAEGAHEQDLDRDARLQEAAEDARLALQHAGELAPPGGMSAEQFENMIVEMRAEAHEVLGTVAYKRRDYRTAIDEYNAAAIAGEEHTAAAVWLRLAAAHDKMGEYSLGIAAIEKALAAARPGSPARKLAEKELIRLRSSAAEAATRSAATPMSTPAPSPGEDQRIQETEKSRSPAEGE